MKIVEITWLDSSGVDTMWDSKHNYTWGREKYRTAGYLLKRKGGYQYVCQSYSKSQYGRLLRIPVKAIVSIKKLS